MVPFFYLSDEEEKTPREGKEGRGVREEREKKMFASEWMLELWMQQEVERKGRKKVK